MEQNPAFANLLQEYFGDDSRTDPVNDIYRQLLFSGVSSYPYPSFYATHKDFYPEWNTAPSRPADITSILGKSLLTHLATYQGYLELMSDLFQLITRSAFVYPKLSNAPGALLGIAPFDTISPPLEALMTIHNWAIMSPYLMPLPYYLDFKVLNTPQIPKWMEHLSSLYGYQIMHNLVYLSTKLARSNIPLDLFPYVVRFLRTFYLYAMYITGNISAAYTLKDFETRLLN